jgi:hypothetical protein
MPGTVNSTVDMAGAIYVRSLAVAPFKKSQMPSKDRGADPIEADAGDG